MFKTKNTAGIRLDNPYILASAVTAFIKSDVSVLFRHIDSDKQIYELKHLFACDISKPLSLGEVFSTLLGDYEDLATGDMPPESDKTRDAMLILSTLSYCYYAARKKDAGELALSDLFYFIRVVDLIKFKATIDPDVNVAYESELVEEFLNDFFAYSTHFVDLCDVESVTIGDLLMYCNLSLKEYYTAQYYGVYSSNSFYDWTVITDKAAEALKRVLVFTALIIEEEAFKEYTGGNADV